jgi:hypothetical protein
MLTLEQQQKEARLTAKRAKRIGHTHHVEWLESTYELYIIKNQIRFHEFGHDQAFDNDIVDGFFKQRKGRFLCIGSANGQDQTYSLLQKGWSGVYCDPDPMALSANSEKHASLLQTTHEYQDKVIIVNLAITPNGGICEFYINKTLALSTTKKKLSVIDSRTIVINSISFNQLLDLVGTNFNYVQIDAEGLDKEIAESINWSTRLLNCKMIGIESGFDCWQHLVANGYVLTDITEHNMYFKLASIVNYG